MGFTTTAIAAAATVAQTAISTASSFNQSKQLSSIAEEQKESGEEQKELLINNALANNTRAKKNMQNELAGARVDAAANNLAPSGSTYKREVAMATRLQDEITNTTESTLQSANLAYEQSLIDASSTSMQASAAKMQGISSIFQGLGSLAKL